MLVLLGLLLGFLIGFYLIPFQLPFTISKYSSVAFLAGLDSVLGGARAGIENKFDFTLFTSGFITNTLLAVFLTLAGDVLGVDLYLAAVVTFGVRIFQNLAYIRRDLIGRPAREETAMNDLMNTD
ncbi:MAG: small basic family protein [Candidatus Eremiobacterota bacterium]